MQTESPHPSPWEHFLLGFAIVGLAAFVTVRLHETSFLHWADLDNLDAWILVVKPQPSPDIVVVDITDADYQTLFDAQSPLSPARVRTLIWAITATNPKALGVDLDTSGWDPSQRQWLFANAKIDQPNLPGAVPVVWAQGGSLPGDQPLPNGKAESPEIHVTFDAINDDPKRYCFAVPTVLPDEDGIVRSYMRSVPDGAGARKYGFAEALAKAASGAGKIPCLPQKTTAAGETYPRIAYSGGLYAFQHFTAGVVLGAAFSDAWKVDNPLRGKIVVLGGTYRAARDKYVTPLGYLDGVDILAHSLQSARSKNGVREVGKDLFLWIDLALGATLVTLTYWKKLWVELLAFLMIPVVSLAASLAIYSSLGYFASVMPVMLGVAVHKLMEHAVEHHKLNREVKRLRHELHSLKSNIKA